MWVVLQLMAIGLIGTALVLESQRGAIVLAVFALGAMASSSDRSSSYWCAFGRRALPFGLCSSVSTSSRQAVTHRQPRPILCRRLRRISSLALPTQRGSNRPCRGTSQDLSRGLRRVSPNRSGMGPGRSRWRPINLGNAAAARYRIRSEQRCSGVRICRTAALSLCRWRGLSTVYRLASRRRDPLTIAVLGVAVVTLFQWLNGDLYSVAWLFWLTLGWADFQQLEAWSDTSSPDLPMAEFPNALITPNRRTATPQPRPQKRD